MAGGLSGEYDFVAFFDCLHDLPDPFGALRAARSALADDGTVMLVEPMACVQPGLRAEALTDACAVGGAEHAGRVRAGQRSSSGVR
ncbi:methyltransferase domain-containing protein [Pseudonocardia sp. RS010]|uniref:methyltransferase domain-containing protein n=1 Tax=Pseudonocardia sp. RS010 TaxID=3385979 RepID=UPI0039A0FB82